MRLYLTLSPSKPNEVIPMNHINVLTGALHKWLGPNEEHDGLSLYSFGWLDGTRTVRTRTGEPGLICLDGATWFISALDGEFLKRSINGILTDPEIRWGMRVTGVQLQEPPVFQAEKEHRFLLSSPVFLKRQRPDGSEKHFVYSDPESNQYLTENFRYKLSKAGFEETGAEMRFDPNYQRPSTKKTTYAKKDGHSYEFKSSMCPILVKGSEEQKRFAWAVGAGQGTGMGFGAVV
jgi:CRISPR-associated endoribonuclease Cas6